MNLRKLTLPLLLFTLTACSTMTNLRVEECSLSRQLETGDRIVVQTKDGHLVDMHYVLVENGEIRGSRFEDGLQPVTISIESVETIQAKKGEPDAGNSRLTNVGNTLDMILLSSELIRLAL